MQTVTLQVTGMACGGCANTVTQALQALPGVTEVNVSHSEATAEICFDPALVQIEQLKSAIERSGYKVVA